MRNFTFKKAVMGLALSGFAFCSVQSQTIMYDINTEEGVGTYPDVDKGIEYKGNFYFAANDGINGKELWVYDPVEKTTAMAADISTLGVGASSNPKDFRIIGTNLIFYADNEFYSYDGVTATNHLINPGGFTMPGIGKGAEYNGKFYFSANDGTNGTEVWVYDPVLGTTTMALDLNVGSGSSYPGDFRVVGTKLIFKAKNDFYSYDGVTATNHVIKPGGNTYPTMYSGAEYNGKFYFSANDGTNGTEVWVYDPVLGTATMALDIRAGSSSSPGSFKVVGTKLIFTANDGTNGVELFSYDGVTATLHDIKTGSSSTYPAISGGAEYNGKFYFSANDGISGTELWVYDPVLGTATMALDINPGASGSSAGYFMVFGTELLFRANNGPDGTELYSYDGVTATTYDLRTSGSSTPYLTSGAEFNGKFYFSATNDLNGRETYVYDPILGTATMLWDLYDGINNSSPNDFRVFGTELLFTANNGVHGSEFYVSDGVTAPCLDLGTDNGIVTICEGSSYVLGSLTLTNTGLYTDIVTGVTGCDSTVYVDLHITATLRTAINSTICSNGSVMHGGITYNTSGSYNDTLTSVITGCDSISTLNLTVNACTSIEEYQNNAFGVYPNPVNNGTALSIEGNISAKATTFVLYNMIGEIVMETQLVNDITTIETEKLVNGMYIFEIVQNGKVISQNKLMVH